MSDLPIQIVDAHNNPVGGAMKEEAWTKGLIQRVVRISVLDGKGRMLLQKRSLKMALFPGRWDNSAAGHVDTGETYEEAAAHELEEELGLKGMKLRKVGDYYSESTYEWRKLNRFTRAYELVLKNPPSGFTCSDGEVIATEWMTIAKVKRLIRDHPEQVTDGLEQILERYFRPGQSH